jgi:septal ring factor EnvC (AmiA/AmiB activator)
VSKGAVVVSGNQISGNIGALAPQEQAALYFSIQVTP